MIGRILGWSSLLGVAVLAVLLVATWSQATPPLPGEEVNGSVAATLRGGGCAYYPVTPCSYSQYYCTINNVQQPCPANPNTYYNNGPGNQTATSGVCCGALCGMACNVYAATVGPCYITQPIP